MKSDSIIWVLVFAAAAYYFFDSGDSSTYTLYRNSVLDGGMRLHVATFDAHEKLALGNGKYDEYNKENCDLAVSLFQQQPGVKTKFWCEKGRYRK